MRNLKMLNAVLFAKLNPAFNTRKIKRILFAVLIYFKQLNIRAQFAYVRIERRSDNRR